MIASFKLCCLLKPSWNEMEYFVRIKAALGQSCVYAYVLEHACACLKCASLPVSVSCLLDTSA